MDKQTYKQRKQALAEMKDTVATFIILFASGKPVKIGGILYTPGVNDNSFIQALATLLKQ